MDKVLLIGCLVVAGFFCAFSIILNISFKILKHRGKK